jgi:hypothetical protein
MFPDYAEIDRTEDLEEAVGAAYELATAQWAAAIEPMVLPTLSNESAALVPDPEMVVSQSSLALWDQQVATVIVPTVTLVWSYMYARTLWSLNIPDEPDPLVAAGNPQDQEFEDWLLERWDARQAARAAGQSQVAQPTRGPRGLPYGPRRTPDMVAELVALAWQTNPDQVKMAGEMVWDKVSSRRRLEMFLGSYTPAVGRSVPARLRDLLVGTTNRASRLAIPVPELRAKMSSWLTGKVYAYGKPTGRWFVAGQPKVTYSSREKAERVGKGKNVFEEISDPESTPLAKEWSRFRDAARASGLDTAGILNHAVLEAASVSDVEFEKVWCAHMDKRTRDTHFAADGQQVPVDQTFQVGGSRLDFPGDPSGPPAEVASCRCRVGMNTPGAPLPKEQKRNSAQKNEIIHRQRQEKTVSASAAPEEAQESKMTGEMYQTFTDALFAVTGVPTDDRRMLAADIELKMRDFPMPLMWQEHTGEGHKGAVGIGVIESMTYENGEVRGSGYLLNNDNAVKAWDLIAHGVANPSIDMADATGVLAYADGSEVTEVNFDESKPMFQTYKKGTITAATIVSIPAFGQTRLSLNGDREVRLTGLEDAIVAAARYEQTVYDPAMFADADPNLLSTHRLRIDPDTGHVFGFIARWADQHRSVGLGNIRPPRSVTEYEHFHTSPGVHLSDGRILPVGRLTVGIGHAPTRGVSAAAAQAHYDNVDACWAIGRVSEHRLGLYFSGVVAPWASPEKVQMGLASPVSGDWRPIGPRRNLELVAVLSVNTPGFLCKVETDETGEPLSMVASMGSLGGDDPASVLTLTAIKDAMTEVLADQQAALEQAARTKELAARVEQAAVRARIVVGEPAEPLTPTERMAKLLAEKAGQ